MKKGKTANRLLTMLIPRCSAELASNLCSRVIAVLSSLLYSFTPELLKNIQHGQKEERTPFVGESDDN